MKATNLFLTAVAAIALAAYPTLSINASTPPAQTTATDSVNVNADPDKAASKPKVKVAIKGMSVNGRPATEEEKAVAKDMIRKGTHMASKSVQVATTALTNPSKAKQLGEELEAMGDEMERMGDSLAALSEDTTFIYDGDADSIILDQDDIDDIVDSVGGVGKWLEDSWLGKFLGGSMGLMAGGFAIVMVFFILLILLLVFTAPLWIAAIIFYLIGRNDKKVKQRRAEKTQAYATAQTTTTEQQTATGAAYQHTAPIESPDNEMWTSGIRQCCIGVGLIIFFIAIGWNGLWGIGALVACIGVAKLIIAYSAKRRNEGNTRSYQDNAYNYTPTPEDTTYEKQSDTTNYDK